VVGVEDVRRVCLSLPRVSERASRGQPAWFARTQVARMWDDGVLTVKTTERDALAAEDPDTYFWTAHHDRRRCCCWCAWTVSTSRPCRSCWPSPTGSPRDPSTGTLLPGLRREGYRCMR
jgi:hypothetical protein